ncbi:endolytic transglycosylase MltG [Aliidiomarina celeris]|uniref:endolytic transglycosylase MltG n=1 Tax=Aliidiomarina celeris TaxID=2249428 RepID=UPI0013001A67|nr:endolytic transglycosylase MltG [Aliidiomarina celeris]
MLKWILGVLVGLVTVGFAALFALYLWFNHWFNSPSSLTLAQAPVLVEIPRGSHSRSVSRLLLAQGIVSKHLFINETTLYWSARLFGGAGNLQAGVYQVKPEDSLQSLWQRMNNGEQHFFSITFAEGLNFSEWRALVAEHPRLRQEWADLTPEQIIEQLASDTNYSLPEGLLFPDTYRFYAGTTDRQIYQQAFRRMEAVLLELWQQRADDIPLDSPYEALVLASIVEKETGAAHERGKVASVFVNRLNSGMRLQSDPTIVYGLGERYRGVIYRSDIQETTPYNTYRINGLPPTPIAMPGKDAIAATLNPEHTDYYYFVSRNDGTHIFSRTLAEHNRAVQTYQRN